MSDVIHQAVDLFRSEGIVGLARGVYRYFYYQVFREIRYLLSDDTKIHRIGDLAVEVPISKRWQYNRFDEPIEYDLLSDIISEIDKNDVVYDVGAYLGWHVLIGAAAVKDGDGEIVAFEAHPTTYKRLSEVAERAGNSVYIYQAAIYDKVTTASLPPVNNSAAEVSEADVTGDKIEITTVKGDQYIKENNINPPDIVKIDVEGSEMNVLRGLESTLEQSSCRVIYIEIHPKKAPEGKQVYSDVTELLDRIGFEWTILSTSGKTHIKGVRNNFN